MTVKNFQSSNNFDVDETLKPQLRPSLNLDFSKSKQLDSRISFFRNSVATYYDKNSAVLSEQNLLPNSNSFTTSDYASNGNLFIYTTVNAAAAPDGTTTANLVVPGNIAAVPSYYSKNFTGSSPRYYVHGSSTQSIFAKANGYTKIALRESHIGAFYASFDLSTGTILTQSNCTATITAYENNWYRISASSNSYNNYIRFSVYFLDPSYTSGGVTGTWTPNGTDGWLIWGAQLESRDFLTDYVPTTNSKPFSRYMPILKTVAANKPRFHHNPNTRESLGLLIEHQTTNLFTYSEEIDNVAWFKANSSITANTILAPDGTLTADKVVANATGVGGGIQRTYTTTANTNYTMSVYLKKGEYKYVRLHWGKSGSPYTRIRIIINLDDGSFTNTDSGTPTSITTRSVTDVGNGWYRCSLGGIFDTTSTDGVLVAEILDDSQNVTHTGNDYSGLYFWGAQLEQASFPTSYIKTTGSQVTRSVDSASMTGTNFTNFFSSQVGTLLAHFGKINEGDTEIGERLITIYPDNNTVKYNLEGYRAEVRYSSSWDSQNFNNETRAGGKVAMAFDETGFISASNGVSQGTTTRVPYTFKATRMYIGSASNNGQANACIQKIAYYPIRLTSNELVDLTEE